MQADNRNSLFQARKGIWRVEVGSVHRTGGVASGADGVAVSEPPAPELGAEGAPLAAEGCSTAPDCEHAGVDGVTRL